MRRLCSVVAIVAAVALGGCSSVISNPRPTAYHPTDPQQRYSVTSVSTTGTLKDLASQVTLNVILRRHGARLLRSEPYTPCPGEAGLQTFEIPARGGPRRLLVAFTVWNGTAITASYERPQSTAADSGALDAMTHSVCTL